MAGLRRICKLYGGMVIQGVKWSWDYAAAEPVLAADMPVGSERWKASERAKWSAISDPKGEAQGPTDRTGPIPGGNIDPT